MKRLMRSSLITFLQDNPNCLKADLFAIELPNGSTIFATDGQWDVTASIPGASGSSSSVTVPATAMPWIWNGGFNTSWECGDQLGTDPVVIDCSGAGLISLSATGTTIGGRDSPPSGPDGVPRESGDVLPSNYVPGGIGDGVDFMALVGAFTDAGGNVISVVYVRSLATLTVPPGAVNLQLGINDSRYADNTGSYTVNVETSPINVTTFYATKYGRWSRGPITSEAGYTCNANTMNLSCVPQPGTPYPDLSVGILSAALNHLFDGATVRVYTAYMPIGNYGNTSAGVEVKFFGTITKAPEIGRNKVQFECADPFYLLAMKVPSRLMQSNCPWSFADANCTLAPDDYTVNFTAAASGLTRSKMFPEIAFTQADGYFTQGVVRCISGTNAGLAQTVKVHVGGSITVMVPWLLPVNPGDTFAVIKGCDKTLGMCRATINPGGSSLDNSVNFGGTPFVPVPSSSI